MLSLARFLFSRLLSTLLTLIVITAILYAIIMMTPAETRAELYIPRGANMERLSEQQKQAYINRIIQRYRLNDPYPLQYLRWIANLAQGQWGYSQTMSAFVLDSLMARTPVTAELTLYSLLFLIPLGLVSGAIAGWNRNRIPDDIFRASAFVAASLPSFVLSLVLMSIFYVGLHWFPPERLGTAANMLVNSPDFISYTGL
jgi:peptide/nickel transport system permease protein